MDRTKKTWAIGILFVITLVINALGAIGLINGLSQKEISDRYITLITPSSSTFSIWSLIYSLLLLSIILLVFKRKDPYYQRATDEIAGLFMLSSLLNIVWIVSFSYVLVELSVLFILGFAIVLALLNQKLLTIRQNNRWILPLAFGFYNGWLFIATVVNTAAALVKLKWNGFGLSEEIWGIAILLVSLVLVFLVLSKLKNASFPLPVAWAYLGINQYLKAPDGFKGAYPSLETVALAGAAVLVAMAAFRFVRNKYSLLPKA